MKVLWITNTPCSSAERNNGKIFSGGWLSSLEKAVRNEIDLEIAFLSPEQEEEDFIFDGVRYHSIAPFASRCYLLFRLKRLLMSWTRQDRIILGRIEEIIRRIRPDIIHVHGTEKCFGLISAVPGGKAGYFHAGGKDIPVVISIQGIMSEIVRKYYSGISAKDARKCENLSCRLHKRSAIRMYRQLEHQARNEDIILRSAMFIIGRTEWDRELTGRRNPERIYFTVNEIMRAPFYNTPARDCNGRMNTVTPDENGRSDSTGHTTGGKRLTVKIVSTISDGIYKGYELLLKTACALRKSGIGYSWTVIGHSRGSGMVSMAEKSTGLKSEDLGIRLAGRMDAGKLAMELSDADIYCQVSHIENSPNSLCEAMLAGLPSVATDVGGTGSIIDNGKTGLLVPDSDPVGMANAIIRLASDRELAEMMGKAARETALERHDPEKTRSRLLDTYRQIIQRL